MSDREAMVDGAIQHCLWQAVLGDFASNEDGVGQIGTAALGSRAVYL
jgi:hypothetical protein